MECYFCGFYEEYDAHEDYTNLTKCDTDEMPKSNQQYYICYDCFKKHNKYYYCDKCKQECDSVEPCKNCGSVDISSEYYDNDKFINRWQKELGIK